MGIVRKYVTVWTAENVGLLMANVKLGYAQLDGGVPAAAMVRTISRIK